jgi:hypothetical protein
MTYSCYITRYMRLLYNMLHYAGVPVGVTVGHWHRDGGGPTRGSPDRRSRGRERIPYSILLRW